LRFQHSSLSSAAVKNVDASTFARFVGREVARGVLVFT
jgi:hypothetical protein